MEGDDPYVLEPVGNIVQDRDGPLWKANIVRYGQVMNPRHTAPYRTPEDALAVITEEVSGEPGMKPSPAAVAGRSRVTYTPTPERHRGTWQC